MTKDMGPDATSPSELDGADETLHALARGISAATGEAFFHSLVQALATTLHVDHVAIGEVIGLVPETVRTLAVWSHGQRVANMEYPLAHTPCEHVVTRQFCCYPSGVREKFPEDRWLLDRGVESYVGTALRASSGQVLGLMAVMDGRPLGDARKAEALLHIFAVRAAAEMERLQAEASLRRSEERFRALVEKSTDGVILMDAAGQITYASPSNQRLLGYSPEELTGRNWTEFTHRDFLAPLRLLFSEALLNPECDYPFRNRVRHRDGSWRDVEANGVNRLDEPGVQALVVNYRDVTERQRAEESLRESEEECRLIVQHVDEIIWTARVRDKPFGTALAFVSDRVEELTGHPADDFLHDATLWPRLIHPEDQAAAALVLERLAEDRRPLTHAYRLRHSRTGAYRWLEDRLVPQLGPDGQLASIFGVARDVTERKQAEQALRESEQRFRDLFESSPDAIFVEDLEGSVLDVNPAACRLHGLGRGELIGKNVLDLVPPAQRDQVREDFPRLAEGQAGPTRGYSFTGDGRSVPVELMASRITYAGRPALLLHVRDLTERERLEEQFRQAQKMEAVGRLAGGVAHDFNNLLTGICGYSELLLHGLAPNDPIREGLEQILRAGERAAALTRQLLAFSRKQVLLPRVLDLNAIIAETEKLLRPLLGADVRLVLVLDPGLRSVRADPGQLEQVIMNLAVNARDAMPAGGQLTLETGNTQLDETFIRDHPEVTPGPYTLLAVSDTGSGMTEEVQAHLFEPFFTTKEVGKGTGLGLATVYGIVKQSGGHIAVSSSPGWGTTFHIYLPALREMPERAGPREVRPDVPGGWETVLLVEDEDTVRSFLCTILRRSGYTVLEACNGGEALLTCERHLGVIHLLLTDVVMPQMSGLELAQRLAGLRPEMKVLYMSGYSDEIGTRPGEPVDENCYLQKPFAPDVLTLRVRQMLDR